MDVEREATSIAQTAGFDATAIGGVALLEVVEMVERKMVTMGLAVDEVVLMEGNPGFPGSRTGFSTGELGRSGCPGERAGTLQSACRI